MKVSRLPLEDSRWGEFTSSHPEATPFHLPEWARLLADCYRFEAFVLALCDTDGELLAGVPVVAVRLPLARPRLVSLPFSDSCPVLARPGVDLGQVARALLQYVRADGDPQLLIRHGLPPAPGVHPVEVGYCHSVVLPRDVADLRPHRNFRQHRNQADRAGVQVRRGGPDDIATFYRLHTLTRRRLGVPVQPRRFFDLLRDRLIAAGHGFVVTASLDDEVLAAGVYLVNGGTIVAKYQASDPGRRDTGASHLMHWQVIANACRQGYRLYDLGRTDHGADGLRTFKTRMGAEESPLVYTHIGDCALKEKGLRIGSRSRRIIRRLPPWACRAVGEVCYRWTA